MGFGKKKILKGIQTMLEEKTPEMSMTTSISRNISRKVMKDPEVEFLLRSFKNRYNLRGAVCITPEIKEDTLNISKWCLKIDNKNVLETEGYQELTRQITELVLTTDKEKIESFLNKIINKK